MRFCWSRVCKEENDDLFFQLGLEREALCKERKRFDELFISRRDLEKEREQLLSRIDQLKQQLAQQKMIPCVQCGFSSVGPDNHPRKDPVSIGIFEARERLEKSVKNSQAFVDETKSKKKECQCVSV